MSDCLSIRPRPLVRLSLPLWVALFLLWAALPVFASDVVHVVQRGESLSTIAQRYDISMGDLAGYNGLSNQNFVWVGQRLLIPGQGQSAVPALHTSDQLPGNQGYHVVQRGEMLSAVARAYGMDVNDLMRLNGLTNPNLIWVGQKLRVSARVEALIPDDTEPAVAGNIYVVQPGDSLAQIAKDHSTTIYELMASNGLPNPNFVWTGQRLRIPQVARGGFGLASAPANGYKWIEVNLSNQTLTAWQGEVAVLYTNISSGLAGTPTVTGRFQIGTKYSSQRMVGPGYDLPGVPWVMYFYGGYALHGAYWHNNFGAPMSHGCVNMRPGEAQLIYNWAPAGTEVYVHY